MQLPEVEMIGPKPKEAIVEQPKGTITAAVVGLRGQEDLLSPLSQGCAVVVSAAGVGGRSIAVGDAQIECAVYDSDRPRCLAMGAQYSLTAQA
jgi:hypothetical protein